MKLKVGTTVTVKLDGEELQFLIVHAGGDGKERLNLKAPLARLLGAMAVGDTVGMWAPAVQGAKPMCVKLIAVEEAK